MADLSPHQPTVDVDHGVTVEYCLHDGEFWPCDTVVASPPSAPTAPAVARPRYRPTWCVACRLSDDECGRVSLAYDTPCCAACHHVPWILDCAEQVGA